MRESRSVCSVFKLARAPGVSAQLMAMKTGLTMGAPTNPSIRSFHPVAGCERSAELQSTTLRPPLSKAEPDLLLYRKRSDNSFVSQLRSHRLIPHDGGAL